MADEKKYYIHVPGALVEVSKELYSEYHRIERHLLTLEEKDRRNGVTHLYDLNTGKYPVEDVIVNRYADSLEEHVIAKLMADKVKRCVNLLPKSEQDLIHAIYYEGYSERQIAEQMGIPYMTLHDRKRKILGKLKKLLEK